MNDTEIITKLHAQAQAKAKLSLLNKEIARIAVEEIGLPQCHLGKVDAKAYINGYLAAKGVDYVDPTGGG